MYTYILQISGNATSHAPDLIQALSASWYVWGPIIAILIFLLKAGTNVSEWKKLIKETKIENKEHREQKRIEKSIITEIHNAREKINSQIGFNAFQREFEIEWTNGTKSKVEVDREKNKVIAILQNDDTSSESFARSAYFYSQKSLLPDTKKHMPRDMANAIDLVMTKKIIGIHRPDAIPFFEDEIYQKDAKKAHVKNQCIAYGTLDDKGQFTRILLRELYEIGYRLSQVAPNKWIHEEMKELQDYCTRMGNRKTGEKNLNDPVKGRYIRFAVSFIAIDWTEDNFKTVTEHPDQSAHIRHINGLIKDHIDSIWLVAKGIENVKYCKWLLEYYSKNPDILEIKPLEFQHPYEQVPTMVGSIKLKPALDIA